MKLQIGMKVRIKQDKGYGEASGTVKTVTGHRKPWKGENGYELDDVKDEYWVASDFSENVTYPHKELH